MVYFNKPLPTVEPGLHCPRCGRPEVNKATDKLFIRGYKVDMGRGWESECLVCNIWFLDDGTITEEDYAEEGEKCYDDQGMEYPLVYCKVHYRWFRVGFECPRSKSLNPEKPCKVKDGR
jgi:hypothetical protein